MEIKQLDNQKGFTLVEIAIVLVIIGLLLGGVLKGQELITNSKIKAVTSDFDNISAAYYAYQDRTGNIPGDAAAAGGATDGIIANDDAFWFDLKTEGFISGALGAIGNSDGPNHDLSGVWSASAGGVTAADVFTTNYICASNIPETFAAGIDAKLDDGVAFTGTIRTLNGTGGGAPAGTAAQQASQNYLAGSQVLVNLCKTL